MYAVGEFSPSKWDRFVQAIKHPLLQQRPHDDTNGSSSLFA